ncbi:MAG: hypothetical protein M1816_003542 [Peltula sp. TS41687]|nr:MAG: hypothetical protein M1816_003542 [Peltula sp. TS41687]
MRTKRKLRAKGKTKENPQVATVEDASRVHLKDDAEASAVDASSTKYVHGKRAFGLEVVDWRQIGDPKLVIDRDLVQADQGSDINFIYPGMVRKLKLQPRDTQELDNRALYMNVASGAAERLRHWMMANTTKLSACATIVNGQMVKGKGVRATSNSYKAPSKKSKAKSMKGRKGKSRWA